MKTIKLLMMSLFTIFSSSQVNAQTEEENKRIVQSGFDNWANGSGSFFDLLAENALWTISGSSSLSKTYTSKKQLLDEVIVPLNERLSKKIVPQVRKLYTDGNTVIAIWDGKATTLNGEPYNVSYAWFMRMEKGKIVEVTAFLDTIDFEEIMSHD